MCPHGELQVIHHLFLLQFQQENAQLFDHMSSLVDEVRQIEGKVVEISQLQKVFTEKVLEQVIH